MSNLINVINSSNTMSNGGALSEHTVVRVAAGNVDLLRGRLADALEQLGYHVLDENPLRARHGARGAGSAMMSANALDYPTTVQIALKQQGTGATRVTFDYAVQHGAFGKGDCQTLTREAEALLALAAQRAAQVECAVCGADLQGESRFCRKCGAPAMATAPAELEVLRLTANVRAGHQWTVIGLFMTVFTTIFPLLLLWLKDFSTNPKPMRFLIAVTVIGFLLSAWTVLAGIWKTHRTLNPLQTTEPNAPRLSRATLAGTGATQAALGPATPFEVHNLPTPNTNELELGAQPQPLSITEATTNLLHEARAESEPEYVPRERMKEFSG